MKQSVIERYRKYLPSKRFISITISVFGVLALILLGREFFSGRKKISGDTENTSASNGTLISISELAENDRDKDGVADWEEALWGTDPNNTDSDGNGISDKVEIDGKKNTLTLSSAEQSTEALDETEAFSRELFISISALKESGNLNEQSIRDLAETISQNAGEKEFITPVYTKDSIQTTNEAKVAVTNYHSALLTVLKRYDESGIGTELSSIEAALSTEDQSTITDIENIAKKYQSLAKDLIGITVPSAIVDTHLELANSASGISVSLTNTAKLFDNAMLGLIGISQYEKQSSVFDTTFSKLQEYFKSHGILK
ncbi:MAG: hypothetical protein MUD00_00665 [Candidatus Pacebacteria bacterium]|jgi:hypothetical protein|nr:hypothetical protein [Candidatus Paceibacterota bacterium]